jgi:hypothetical protein
MFRWRCLHRACARARTASGTGRAYARCSTKKKIQPRCAACSSLMTLDKTRTTKREKRRGNCHCTVVNFVPHQRNYCRRLEVRQYEDSIREADGVLR